MGLVFSGHVHVYVILIRGVPNCQKAWGVACPRDKLTEEWGMALIGVCPTVP